TSPRCVPPSVPLQFIPPSVPLQRDVLGHDGLEQLDKDGRIDANRRSLQQGEAPITSVTSVWHLRQ
ncbi:unnamed protein product, partial [Symbiodinium pilosum]